MNRKQQQAELLVQLGDLLSPIQDLVNNPIQHNDQSRSKACAKFTNDFQKYGALVQEFSKSEPGHNYWIEFRIIDTALAGFALSTLGGVRDNTEKLRHSLAQFRNTITQALLSIPTDIGSEVLEAHAPFQAYYKLKAYFETTRKKLVWTDPYMGSSIFNRYLNDIAPTVETTLVTMDRTGKSDHADFLDVSKLYAQERGPTKYRLISEMGNHDRWLRCDDQLYHLGGSAKDAGGRSPFTISKLDPTPENFQKLDALIAGGTELFGPNNPTHP